MGLHKTMSEEFYIIHGRAYYLHSMLPNALGIGLLGYKTFPHATSSDVNKHACCSYKINEHRAGSVSVKYFFLIPFFFSQKLSHRV